MTASGLPAHEKVTMTVGEIEDLVRVGAEEAARRAIDALLALPVEQRMEAMGMTRVTERLYVERADD